MSPGEEITQFRYKGKRTYVQGPDIYDAVLQFAHRSLGDYPESMSGSFHCLLRNNGIIRLQEADIIRKDPLLCAYFTLQRGGKHYYVSVVDAGVPIAASSEYDEADVLSSSSFAEKTAAKKFSSGYTYLEQFIAMNKALHIANYPDASRTGKWLFVKFEMRDAIDPAQYRDGAIIRVRIEQSYYNKHTRSVIGLENRPVGSVWFSLFKP